MSGFDSTRLAKLSRLRQLASIWVMLVGAFVLLGWLLDIDRMKGGYSDIAMKANTAFSLLLAGASLWTLNPKGTPLSMRRIGQVCAAMVALIGLMTLSQHLFGWNLGIDQLLFSEPPGAPATTSPGRMGPPASTCLMLSGTVLVLLHARRAVSFAQVLSIIVSLWALLAILGYAYQAKELYGVAHYTGIALLTAVTLFCLSFGLLIARADQGIVAVISSSRAGSVMARRLMIAAFGVPFLLGWLRLLGERAGYYDLGFGTALLVLGLISIFTLLIWQSAARINRTEQAVTLANERFRLAEMAANGFVYDWDFKAGNVERSEGLLKVIGYRPDEVPSTVEWWSAQLHPEDVDIVNQVAPAALKLHSKNWSNEYRVRHKEGHYVYVLDRGLVMHDADGRVVRIVGSTVDITERKLAEEKIKMANYRFRLAEEAVNGFVYDWNLLTDKVERSESFSRLLGYAPGEIAPTWDAWLDLLHSEDRKLTRDEVVEFLDRHPEETFRLEFRAHHQGGHYCWLEERGLILRDERGRANRIIGQMVDINARKELEQERERLLAEELHLRQVAEAANRSKDEFLAVVSHELRSPLNAILGYNRLLRKMPLDAEQVGKACDVIERSARLQLQLIEDLLDTARIISGKLRLDVRPIDLVPVLNEAVETMRPAIEAKGIELLVQFNLQPEIITADAARLLQVIVNLLSNAIKFTPEGGLIELRMESDAKQARIIVRDTGQGIAREFLPFVFDRFRQSDSSSTRRYGGLGLGLALVKHLTELHGGKVEAASAGVGQGSTFTVTLPLMTPLDLTVTERPALAASREVRTENTATIPEAATIAGLRLLLVDDQAEARALLTNFLSERGAHVTAVASGDEALTLLANPPDGQKPDIFISDIAMPNEDGYAVLARVRALETARGTAVSQQLPAIALTAMARSEDRLRALTAGFQMHIAKPVEPAELLVVIASLARQHNNVP